MGRPPLLALAAAAALAVAVPSGGPARAVAQTQPQSYDDAIRSQKQQLEALRKEAEATRARARELGKQEQGVLSKLNRAEQAIAATREYLRRLEERETLLEIDIQGTERELTKAQTLLAALREQLARQLRFSYMHGKARTLEVVFSAATFGQLLERGAFLSRVLHEDEKLILEVEEQQAKVEDTLARLRGKQQEVQELRDEKERERRQYESLKGERERDLVKVRSEKQEHERAARELEAAAKRMQGVIAELERKRLEALRRKSPVQDELDRNDFGKNRGRLPWPVEGEILDAFGRHEHPKYKTVTLNNGVDIAAPVGTPVRCVGDGVVDLVQWISGYGQTVIVNHGRGFYTIYAHLSSVSVREDDRVVPAQLIGASGDTGSLKGPCLHFEVREAGAAQDPAGWLR